MSGTQLVGEIITVTGRLLALLDREVEYLKNGRVKELTPLQQEKLQLIGAYEAQLGRFRFEPSIYAAVAPTLKQELEAATRRLDHAVERNANALRGAREVNRRLMDSIARAAAGEQTAGPGYARPGTTARPAPSSRRQAISVTLDQRL